MEDTAMTKQLSQSKTLVDGQVYDLGATNGTYHARSDTFQGGNWYVSRADTIYREWERPGTAVTLSGLYNCDCCGEEKCVTPGICKDCATPPTDNPTESYVDQVLVPLYDKISELTQKNAELRAALATALPYMIDRKESLERKNHDKLPDDSRLVVRIETATRLLNDESTTQPIDDHLNDELEAYIYRTQLDDTTLAHRLALVDSDGDEPDYLTCEDDGLE
jgi:hypothetical protein